MAPVRYKLLVCRGFWYLWLKGQCFTVTFAQKFDAKNMNLSVALKKGLDYDIYLNSAGWFWPTYTCFKSESKFTQFWILGASFWLNLDKIPKHMTKLRLETQNNGLAKIHLNKEVITDLEFCEDNVDENYDSCVKARNSIEMDGTLHPI